MKTLTLKLKRDVLIVDLPETASHIRKSGRNLIYHLDASWVVGRIPEGNWEFLCQGTPTEEQLSEIELMEETVVYQKIGTKQYRFRCYTDGFIGFKFRVESFLSAISAENWNWLVNPIKKQPEYCFAKEGSNHFKKHKEYWESESRTFKNPILFIKE